MVGGATPTPSSETAVKSVIGKFPSPAALGRASYLLGQKGLVAGQVRIVSGVVAEHVPDNDLPAGGRAAVSFL